MPTPCLAHHERAARRPPARTRRARCHTSCITSAQVDAGKGTVTLKFANTGRAAAVFHVDDKLHLDRVPRRYVVEPGKALRGNWAALADDDGKYDLWVLGPNGYLRRFTGDLAWLAGAPARRLTRRGPIRLKRPPGAAQTSEGWWCSPHSMSTKMLRVVARSR